MVVGIIIGLIIFVIIGYAFVKSAGKQESDTAQIEDVKRAAMDPMAIDVIIRDYQIDCPVHTLELFKYDDPLAKLNELCPAKRPTVLEFKSKCRKALIDVLAKMGRDGESKQEILEWYDDFVADMTEEDIDDVLNAYNQSLTTSLYPFFRNRVNYKFSCLGILNQYAEETESYFLKTQIERMSNSLF